MTISRMIFRGLLIALVGGVIFLVFKKTFYSIEVKTEIARHQPLELTVSGVTTGTIKSDTEVRVTSQRTGRVSKLFVKEGDIVKPGSAIAELDTEEAYINLQISRASFERAQAVLNEMKTALEPLGVEVETAIERADANLKDAEKKLKRLKELKDKGFVSEMELDSAELIYNVAKANYESAISGRKGLISKTEEIKAQGSALKEAKNALLLAELNYKYSFIKAPISGVISSMPVRLGETLMKGSPIATLISTESFYIEAFIDEADVAKVRLSQDVHISMDAYPQKTLAGKVYMISPVVLGGRQETKTFEVRIRLKEKGINIKLGMSADIEIVVDRLKNALAIPSQAVIEKNGMKYVFLKIGSKARLTKVKTGLSNWTYTELISGVNEGDEIIVNPDTPKLKDGVRIKSGTHS